MGPHHQSRHTQTFTIRICTLTRIRPQQGHEIHRFGSLLASVRVATVRPAHTQAVDPSLTPTTVSHLAADDFRQVIFMEQSKFGAMRASRQLSDRLGAGLIAVLVSLCHLEAHEALPHGLFLDSSPPPDAEVDERNLAREFGFFGEIDRLERLLSWVATNRAADPSGISFTRECRTAALSGGMVGDQLEVISWAMNGLEHGCHEVQEIRVGQVSITTFRHLLTLCRDLCNTLTCERMIGDDRPDLLEEALRLKAVKPAVATELLSLAGEDPRWIKLFVSAGATPYAVRDGRPSLCEDLLARGKWIRGRAVDYEKRYASEWRRLERECEVSAKSAFVGEWGYPATAGFGGMHLLLHRDGTGGVNASLAGAELRWREQKGKRAILELKAEAERATWTASFARSELVVKDSAGKEVKRLKRVPPFKPRTITTPRYHRIELIILAGDRLWVQVNGSHASRSVKRLSAALRIRDDTASPALLIKWSELKPGPIPAKIIESGSAVPYEGTYAIPGYKDGGRTVELRGHDAPAAAVKPGFSATLFKAGQGRYPGEDEETSETDFDDRPGVPSPYCYILLFERPLQNGLNWLHFFLGE